MSNKPAQHATNDQLANWYVQVARHSDFYSHKTSEILKMGQQIREYSTSIATYYIAHDETLDELGLPPEARATLELILHCGAEEAEYRTVRQLANRPARPLARPRRLEPCPDDDPIEDRNLRKD